MPEESEARIPSDGAPRHEGSAAGVRRDFEADYARTDMDPWGLSWRPSQRQRYRLAHRILKETLRRDGLARGLRILDVGASSGDFTAGLERAYGRRCGGRVLGIDLSEIAVERARGRHPGVAFEKMDLLDVRRCSGEAYDVVTCLEVLYYLDEKERIDALESVAATLRPGGYLLASSLVSPRHFLPDVLRAEVGRFLRVLEVRLATFRVWAELESRVMAWGARRRLRPLVNPLTAVLGLQGFHVGGTGRLLRELPRRPRETHVLVLARRDRIHEKS